MKPTKLVHRYAYESGSNKLGNPVCHRKELRGHSPIAGWNIESRGFTSLLGYETIRCQRRLFERGHQLAARGFQKEIER